MLYSQIKQYLYYGLMVVVIDNEEMYRVFIHQSDEGLMSVGSKYTIEDALRDNPLYWSKDELDSPDEQEDGWRIHSLLPRPITPYPVGMKVRVDKSFLDFEGTKGISGELIKLVSNNNIFEIVEQDFRGSGRMNYGLTGGWTCDHRFLIPVLEEEKEVRTEPTREDWLDTGARNGWVKEGVVISN